MAHDETSLSFEQPRSTFGTWVGVILLFVLFALFVWAIVGMMPRGDDYEAKRAKARMEKLKTATEEAQTTLHSYGWVEKDKGVAHIPIDRAMELTMADLAQKKPAPAGPIATPPPAAAPPAAAASPGAGGPAVPSPAPAASATPSASPQTSHSGPGSVMGNQPAAAANPENAPPGTQPGPAATPAASPLPPSEQPPGPPGARGPTPVQTSAGTPIPVHPEHP